MTRDEAEARCRELSETHPERATHRWFPRREANGGWVVAKVDVPAGTRIDPLGTSIRAEPAPPPPQPDPRTSHEQNVGGNWVGA
jgi:hypothetical protein